MSPSLEEIRAISDSAKLLYSFLLSLIGGSVV